MASRYIGPHTNHEPRGPLWLGLVLTVLAFALAAYWLGG